MTDIATTPAAIPKRASRWSRIARSIGLLRESYIGMFGAFLLLFWIVLALTADFLPLRDPLVLFWPCGGASRASSAESAPLTPAPN